ncbi:hypothetical protein SVA_2523 [Sulfurifustis variabilis]|uniref:Uncharacterized protein n=1 Tax=Sulfurifustis variabilis TaxID=1675686 RepID=A0A1B4VCD1_9GAMM|nr:hypothetical protein [Sulfurifustis variabilis]BAU49071.1 hypothetical protein SVA_2523 [Sulfurifustis variabilis]
MRQGRARRARRALLIAAFSLPVSHTASAVDIHYARAIGDPYEYRLPPASRESADPATDPASGSVDPSGAPGAATTPAREIALPGLGSETRAPAPEEGGRVWPKILIGVLLVGAMAALAGKDGGGGGDVQVNAGVDLGGGSGGGAAAPPVSSGGGASSGGSAPEASAPSSGNASPPPSGSGGGGPTITIGTGGNGAGRPGGREDDDDDDDDDGKGGRGKGDKKGRK